MSRRRSAAVVVLLWLANLVRWTRHTAPEPLPPPPVGSTTVVARDGARLYAQVAGDASAGLTVVLVHGLLARSMSFDMQWHHLLPVARVIRYDHRNHGRSDHVSTALDVETLAGDLLDVIDALAPTGPLVLVGQSMGGMTVMALAARKPALFEERVRGVALIATAAGHDITVRAWENRLRAAARAGVLSPLLLVLRLLAPALERIRPRRTHTMRAVTRSLVFGSSDADPGLLAMTQEVLEEPPLSTLAAIQGSLLRVDVRSGLAVIREAGVPALVLAGADDRLIPAAHSRRIAHDLAGAAELVVLPGAGHVVNQSRASETNDALVRLLSRCRSAGPAAAD